MNNTPVYLVNWWHATDNPPPDAVRFYYYQYYIPGGFKDKQLREVFCLNDIIFFRLLNQWNRNRPDKWHYWSECT